MFRIRYRRDTSTGFLVANGVFSLSYYVVVVRTDGRMDGSIIRAIHELQCLQKSTRSDTSGGRMKRDTERAKGKSKGGKGRKGRKGSTKKTESRKKNRKISLPVAQYDGSLDDTTVQDITDIHFDSRENIDGCRMVDSMDGTLCLNKTFIPSGKPLNIFKTASWGGDKASPFVRHPTYFSVKSSGIHLVFAQILFQGNEPDMSASVVQRRDGTIQETLSCHVAGNRRESCTIIGFMNLKADDVIKVESNNKHAALIRSEGNTYLGVMRVTNERKKKSN